MNYTVTETRKYASGWAVEISDTMTGFRHRITYKSEAFSQWVCYTTPAQLGSMRHCTEYYSGQFPTERLFRVRKMVEIK